MVSTAVTAKRAATLAVIVAALGYFVDIYDLILFSMVRVPSLTELGVAPDQQLAEFKHMLSMQMWGMLAGGILWGVIGDKRGRLSVLFGSITLYSIANIANGMVHSLDAYGVWRLIAGIGLAGELGAGITLVSELMGKDSRGYGTTVVAALGVSGGILAGLIGGAFPDVPHPSWRVAYFVGGGLGLVLLILRIGVVESGMFHAVRDKAVSRGNFLALFTSGKRFVRYIAVILVGVPIWFVIAIPVSASKELGGALGLQPPPNPATATFFCYGACTIGGLASGLLSQKLHSRRRALATFLGLTALSLVLYFTLGGTSTEVMYALCAFIGFASGYWAVFVSTAAELFGTNLRATVTTTVPNFVRGSVPVLLAVWTGTVQSAIAVGAVVLVLAFAGLFALKESFGVDLDFTEE
ncbi:MAG TPA: MFS transporter [Kofleriaceae bacterium]|nr:MFS transporter [Kofleriaceae bacterium]